MLRPVKNSQEMVEIIDQMVKINELFMKRDAASISGPSLHLLAEGSAIFAGLRKKTESDLVCSTKHYVSYSG